MPITTGLDVSLTSTGAVRLLNNNMVNNAAIGSKFLGVHRLVDIEEKVNIFLNQCSDDLVLIEDYAFSKANKAHQMGELGGVIRRMLFKKQIRWIVVGTSQLKKFATGKGNCPKDLILMNVYKKWGVEFATSDEADAYVLARIGQALLNQENSPELTKYQLEVLTELRKKYKEVLPPC